LRRLRDFLAALAASMVFDLLWRALVVIAAVLLVIYGLKIPVRFW